MQEGSFLSLFSTLMTNWALRETACLTVLSPYKGSSGFISRTAERYLLPKTEPSSPLLAVTLVCQHL